MSWTPKGHLPATRDIVAVGGSADGSLLLAGCVQPNAEQAARPEQAAGPCLFRWAKGGDGWQPVAQQPGFKEWGSGQTWWHSRSTPSSMINGNSYVTSQIAVDKNGHTVYVAGRAGVWKSENSGVDWRPAVVGLQGTMHNAIAWDDKTQAIETDDVDFGCEQSPPEDHFSVADHITVTDKAHCPALHGHQASLTRWVGTDKVTIKAPLGDGTPAQLVVNDKPQPTPDWFKAQVIKPKDVLYHDGWLYIVQDGGGIVLGHPQPQRLSAR